MRMLEVDKLRRPHLVLADACDPDGLGIGVLGQLLDDPLRGERSVHGGVLRFVVRGRILFAPFVDLCPPRLEVRLAVDSLLTLDFGD